MNARPGWLLLAAAALAAAACRPLAAAPTPPARPSASPSPRLALPTATRLPAATRPPPTSTPLSTTPTPPAATRVPPTPTPPPVAATLPAATEVAATVPAATPLVPVVHDFSAAPAEIDPGGSVTLTWSAAAERVVVYRLDPVGRLTLPEHIGPPAGSLVITTPAGMRNHVNFVLFAFFGDLHAQAGASVSIRCPDTWFFADPPADCPGGPAALSTLVGQEFESGRMLWLAGPRRIYVLYQDGPGRAWLSRPDLWTPDQPESDPDLIPLPGRLQPVRGFGLVWRDSEALAGTRVRDYLGWALDSEAVWGEGAAQCNSAPRYVTCYVGLAAGTVYKLEPEGSRWSVWAGP